MPIAEIFQRNRLQSAWRTPAGELSYQDLEERVRRYAAYLVQIGAKDGDFFALRGWSAFDTFAWILAGFWQRSVMLPLPDRLPDTVHQQMMDQIPLRACLEASPSLAESLSTGKILDGPILIDSKVLALGIFTSGSTGTPKAILHSWESLSQSALATNQFYQLQPFDSWLLSLDIAHIGGLQIAMRCLLGGGICWHLTEPKAVAKLLREEAPHFISLVPTQLYRLMDDAKARDHLKSCRAIVLGGAAASLELLEEARALKLPVSVSYGSSETAAQCTALPPGTLPRCTGDVGFLLAGWEYQQREETLKVRGRAAYGGFYQNGMFQPAADAQGWITLPDRILCEAGRLTILGRADGLFQVAGENVAPLDIAAAFERLRHAADFLALPIADAEYGTVPILVVRSARKPEIDAILELSERHLTGIQRPRRIYWHCSDDIMKPSRNFYQKSIERGELFLLWSQDFARL